MCKLDSIKARHTQQFNYASKTIKITNYKTLKSLKRYTNMYCIAQYYTQC